MRLFAGLVIATLLFGQDDAIFRSQSTLVTLRFHVVEHVPQGNRYVTSLKKEDVLLFEDGASRPFTVFENAATTVSSTPVEMTLLFDTSGSVMDKGLLDPLAFKESLLDSLPNVKLAVYGFGSTMTKYCGPTRDFNQLQAALQSLGNRGEGEQIELQLPPKRKAEGRGATWLYEAVIAGSKAAAATPGEAVRMVMVISDGLGTTTSKPEDAADLNQQLGIPVYPLLLGHGDLLRKLEEERRREKPPKYSKKGEMVSAPMSSKVLNTESRLAQVAQFAKLGEMTGGRAFDPPTVDLGIMKQILKGMVDEVQTQYTVGFPVDASGNPKKHKLEVRLVSKDMGKISGGTRSVVH
jgi:VWFA-related protein